MARMPTIKKEIPVLGKEKKDIYNTPINKGI